MSGPVCRWLSDSFSEICCNGDCPACADFCPCVIMLTVLLDKWNARDNIMDIWHDVEKLSIECKEGRVSVFDLERVLLEEYEIECK